MPCSMSGVNKFKKLWAIFVGSKKPTATFLVA
jgi:hypothetical protein